MFVDGHLDIAYNVVSAGRDFTRSVAATRQIEQPPSEAMGSCTVGLPDLLGGGVGLVFGTLFTLPASAMSSDLPRERVYTTPEEAHAQAVEQLEVYRRLAAGRADVSLIATRAELAELRAAWARGERRLGLVVLMENGDPIREPGEAAWWAAQGVRIVGPAWQATRYCGGTKMPGPLTPLGRALMPELERAGLVLDVSHMAEESFWQALDRFGGAVIASHSNCRALAPERSADRHLSDQMIKALIERDAVIGAVLFNGFIAAEYQNDDPKRRFPVARLVRHIDHICQIAGSARHCAIGSDLDGGLGQEHIPAEIDSCADLHLLAEGLLAAGFRQADVDLIMGGNWLRTLEKTLP
jgi:membrane dipeptidase